MKYLIHGYNTYNNNTTVHTFDLISENFFKPLIKTGIVIPFFTNIDTTPKRSKSTMFRCSSSKKIISSSLILHFLLILINKTKN